MLETIQAALANTGSTGQLVDSLNLLVKLISYLDTCPTFDAADGAGGGGAGGNAQAHVSLPLLGLLWPMLEPLTNSPAAEESSVLNAVFGLFGQLLKALKVNIWSLLILPSSPAPSNLSPSHPLTLSPSHPLTPSPSHPLTLSPSHSLTLSPSHSLTLALSHLPSPSARCPHPQQPLMAQQLPQLIAIIVAAFDQRRSPCTLECVSVAVEVFGSDGGDLVQSFSTLLSHLSSQSLVSLQQAGRGPTDDPDLIKGQWLSGAGSIHVVLCCFLLLPVASYSLPVVPSVSCSCLDAPYTLRDINFRRLLPSPTVSQCLQPV